MDNDPNWFTVNTNIERFDDDSVLVTHDVRHQGADMGTWWPLPDGRYGLKLCDGRILCSNRRRQRDYTNGKFKFVRGRPALSTWKIATVPEADIVCLTAKLLNRKIL